VQYPWIVAVQSPYIAADQILARYIAISITSCSAVSICSCSAVYRHISNTESIGSWSAGYKQL
jgi:hypothetical protein